MRVQLSLEPFEPRYALSSILPADTIGLSRGAVSATGITGSATVNIAPSYVAQGRSGTVIGLAVTPSAGSSLAIAGISAYGPSGAKLPVYSTPDSGTRSDGSTMTFVLDDTPGPVTIKVSGRDGTSGSFQVRVFLPGDVNGSGHVDLADLETLAHSYLSKVGTANYNPAADFVQSGVISQEDVKLLERNLSDPMPNVPLSLHLQLAPGEAIPHPRTYNSGAITLKKVVTVLGRTLPNSAVFVDGPLGYYKFNGPLLVANAQGKFSYTLNLVNSPDLPSTLFDPSLSFRVIAPDGRELVRNYPILRIN